MGTENTDGKIHICDRILERACSVCRMNRIREKSPSLTYGVEFVEVAEPNFLLVELFSHDMQIGKPTKEIFM